MFDLSKTDYRIRIVVFILSIPLFILSIFRISEYNKIVDKEKSYVREIEELAPKDIINDEPTPIISDDSSEEYKNSIFAPPEERKVQPWAKELLQRNNEAVGWIRIPGFTDSSGNEYINYPVLQHDDNSYYLIHNLDKEYYYSGSIYVDYSDKITEIGQPDNIVLYGHHMRNLGTAFTHLAEYKSGIKLVKKCPIIEFNTIYDEGPQEYIIISCYVAAADEKQDKNLFKYWLYHYFDDEVYIFKEWLDKTLESSWYSCDVKCDKDDDYITLSTCSNEVAGMRWVITAKRLDEDYDKDAIIDSYSEKTDIDIYFPDVWKRVWGEHKKYLGWNY